MRPQSLHAGGIRFLRALAATLLLGAAAQGVAHAQEDEALDATLRTIAAAHHGKVALYAVQLNTGKTAALDPDRPVQTASDIKLALLYTAMQDIRNGNAHWDEKIVLQPGDQVGGAGMLHFFTAPLALTLKDVLTMMVIVSDNTATNLAIDRFPVADVNATMKALGLPNTVLYKKVFKPATGPMPADQPKFGLGKSTPREMATLMARIGRCDLHMEMSVAAAVPAERHDLFKDADAEDIAVCSTVLTMLKAQFYRETVPRYLPNGGDQTVASKTGSLDAVRSDVALVAGKSGPMVLSIFTYDNADTSWTVDNEAEVTIAKLAKAIVDAWSPQGLDAKALVPGLGLGPVAETKR